MAVHIQNVSSTVQVSAPIPLSAEQLEQLVRLVAARLESGRSADPSANEGALYRTALAPLRLE